MLACDSILSFAFSLEPCSFSLPTDTRQYPVFVGHKPGRNTTQRHRLDIQLVTVMNRTLYIAARSVILCFATPLLLTEQEGEEEGYFEFFSYRHVIFRIFSHGDRGLQALSEMYWTPCLSVSWGSVLLKAEPSLSGLLPHCSTSLWAWEERVCKINCLMPWRRESVFIP